MITFARWMEDTLYGPQGYYASGVARSGREGDYFTAPDVGPAFGMLLAAIFRQWAQTFAVQPFHLVECGAGEGKLARILLEAAPELHYTAIERSPARQEKLKKISSLHVYPRLEDIPRQPLTGCIFANELIDAMPVHRVRMVNGQFQEVYVENGQWRWDVPSTPELSSYFGRINITLPENYETEVNLAQRMWLAQAAKILSTGFVVLIDYGRPAWQYYAEERNGGTLRYFKDHVVRRFTTVPSPQPSPTGGEGEQLDITADVDFTSLALDAHDAGLTPLAFMELGSFLMTGARAILDQGDFKAKAPAGLRYLLHPEGMGSAFHVLILGKGVSPEDWPFEANRLSRLGLPSF